MRKKHPHGRALPWITILLAMLLALSMTGCNRSLSKKKPDDSKTSSSQDSEDESEDPGSEAEPDEEDESSSEGEEDESSSQESSSSPSSSAAPVATSSIPQASSSSAPPASSAPPVQPSSSSAPPVQSSSTTATGTNGREYANITYVKKGTYTKTESFQDATIKGGGMYIKNKVFYGDVTIPSGAASGDLTLENVDIKGTFKIQGGSGQIKLYDTHVKNLVIDKKGAKLYAAKKSDIESVTVQEDATLQEGDITGGHNGFENVTVSGSKNSTTDLALKGLSLGELTTKTRSVVNMSASNLIEEANAKAPTYLKGKGRVKTLNAYSDDVYYEHRPDVIRTQKGADKPQQKDSGELSWDDDDKYWDTSSDDFGDDGSGYDSDRSDVYIREISDLSLQQGAGKTITLETNAKSLSVTSSNNSVVSVSKDGKKLYLTGERVGSATVTVKGRRTGYNSDSMSFDVDVKSNASDAPRILNIAGNPTAWTNQNATITFTVQDNDLKSVTANGSALSSPYQFIADKNGDYPIVARDNAGNETTETVRVTKIDKTIPVISEAAGAGTGATFRVTDTGAGVLPEKVRATGSDGSVIVPTLRSGDALNSIYGFTGRSGVVYTIQATDAAGNAAAPQTITLQEIVAGTPPVFSAKPTVTDGNDWKKEKTVSFAITYPSDKEPVVTVQEGFPVTKGITSAAGDGYSMSLYSFKATRAGTFTVNAMNANGAAAPEQVTVTRIDAVAPVISQPAVSNPGVVEPNKTVSFTVTDEGGSGVAPGGVRVNNGATPVNLADGIYSFTADTANVYIITAADVAGNVSTKASSITNIGDIVSSPTINEVIFSSELPTNAPVTVSVEVVDETPIKSVKAVSKTNGVPDQTLAKGADGRYSFVARQNAAYTIEATNTADKKAEKDIAVNNIDTQGPTITTPSVTPIGWTNADKTVSFTVEDDSGIESVQISGKGTLPVTANGAYSFQADNGLYTITARDKAGNTAQVQVQVEKIDRTKPAQPMLIEGSNLTIGASHVNHSVTYRSTGKKFSILGSTDATQAESAVTIYYTLYNPSDLGANSINRAEFAPLSPTLITQGNQTSKVCTIELRSGTNTLTLQARDAAGNIYTLPNNLAQTYTIIVP